MLELKLRVNRLQRRPEEGEQESPYMVGFYLDRRFHRTVHMWTPSSAAPTSNATTPAPFYVAGLVRQTDQIVAREAAASHAMEPDTSLCLQAFRTVYNPEGIACRQDAGAAVIPLPRLLQEKVIEAPLRIHTTRRNQTEALVQLELLSARMRPVHGDGPGADAQTLTRLAPALVSAYAGQLQQASSPRANPLVVSAPQTLEVASLARQAEAGTIAANPGTRLQAAATGSGPDSWQTPFSPSFLARAALGAMGAPTPLVSDGDDPRRVAAPARGEAGLKRIRWAVSQQESMTSTFGAVRPDMNLTENLSAIERHISAYLERYEQERGQLADVYGGTKHIECPVDPSEVTVANSQLAAPFAAYTLHEVPQVSPHFWAQQWRIMAGRRGFADGDALARHLERAEASEGERAAAAMSWCTQFVEMLPYISDMVGSRRPVEMFGDALPMLNGDCEDGSSAILMIRDALRADPVVARGALPGSSEAEQRMHPRLQQLARAYVDLLCIDGVTASHVAAAAPPDRAAVSAADSSAGRDGGDGGPVQCTAAHAAIHALPLDYFVACVKRHDPNDSLAGILETRMARHPLFGASRAPLAADQPRLPVLVGEGTGVIDAGLRHDPVRATRERLYREPAFSMHKKELIGRPGESSDFYKVVLFGATNAFFDSHRRATFHLVSARRPGSGPAHATSQRRYERGVRYPALMRQDSAIALVPYGSLSGSAVEFSEPMVRIVRRVVKNRIPPPPLVPYADVGAATGDAVGGDGGGSGGGQTATGTTMSAMEGAAMTAAERWADSLNQTLARRHPPPNDAANLARIHVFPYCAVLASKAGHAQLQDMARAALQQEGRVVRVGAAFEGHHPLLTCVRLTFYCRP